jgi:hypothetical protein
MRQEGRKDAACIRVGPDVPPLERDENESHDTSFRDSRPGLANSKADFRALL